MNRSDHPIVRRLYENLPEQIPAQVIPFIQPSMHRGPEIGLFEHFRRSLEIWRANIRKNHQGLNKVSLLILLFDGRSLVAVDECQIDIWCGAVSQFSSTALKRRRRNKNSSKPFILI
jgi:hypothetical protein